MPRHVTAVAVIATLGVHGAGVCPSDCCDDPLEGSPC